MAVSNVNMLIVQKLIAGDLSLCVWLEPDVTVDVDAPSFFTFFLLQLICDLEACLYFSAKQTLYFG